MFDGTIRENICLFQKKSEKELEELLKQTELHRVLERKNATLDTPVFENGLNLSGGEKQRIALARMLGRDTPIFLLDEGTSSLDSRTANCILTNLLRDKQRTVIAITHRLEQEDRALYDEIIVMKDGMIHTILRKETPSSEKRLLQASYV